MSAADLPTIPRWALPSAVRLAPKIVLKEFPCVRGRNCFAVRRRSLQHGGNINFRCHPEEVCPHVFMRAPRESYGHQELSRVNNDEGSASAFSFSGAPTSRS